MIQEKRISPELSHRIANMSFVCAIFVVLIHCPGKDVSSGGITWWIEQLLSESFVRMAVPFFFIVSGFFLARHMEEPHGWATALKTRCRTLLAPYFIWSTIWWCSLTFVILFANFLAGREWMANMPPLFDVYGLDPRASPLLGVLWYVRVLFILLLVAPLFLNVICKSKKMLQGGLITLFILAALLGTPQGGTWLYSLVYTFSIHGAFYFFLGVYLWRYPMTGKLQRANALGVLFVGMMIYVLTFLNIEEYVGGMWRCVRAFAIPLTMLGLWSIMSCKRWLKFFQGKPFAIYLCHLFIIDTGVGLLWKNLNISIEYDLIRYLLSAVLGVTLPMLLKEVLDRKLPKLSSLLFGGR
ncbi:MAG: acyltransferase [Kiritimatiellia bacterium]